MRVSNKVGGSTEGPITRSTRGLNKNKHKTIYF